MVIIGTFALAFALFSALISAITGFSAGRSGSARRSEISRRSFYVATGFIGIASSALLYALLTYDFSIAYVQARADTRMPIQYLISAFWGGADGSLLYWILITSTFGSIAIRNSAKNIPEIIPWVQAILSAILIGFLIILLDKSNPFETYFVIDTPVEGEGLNPLLQTPLMVIHPQALLSGFAAMAIPYAFGMGALLAKKLDTDWLKATRTWMLIAWILLSIGNILGGMWAYQELGWGGYWAWDKVENFALIPWFVASAYLHSAIIQEQRGMLKRWNVILVTLTFLLTIFGTYMTRSGFIESVHSFASSEVGPYFFTFLVILSVFSVSLIIRNWRALESENQLDSVFSREGAFIANNWLLVGMAFVVLWGSVFPDIKGLITGSPIAIGPPWFNKIMAPLALLLMFLIVLGTLLPWRRVTSNALRRNFTVPLLTTAVATPLSLAIYWHLRGKHLGIMPQNPASTISILGLAAVILNLTTLAIEFYNGIRTRLKKRKNGLLDAIQNLFQRHRRRYGGYIVHLGIILIFMAFLGNAIKPQIGPTMQLNETVQIADYEITFTDFTSIDKPDHIEHTAIMTLTRNGRIIDELRPARFDFNNYATLTGNQPDPMSITSEIYVRSTPIEDVYIALLGFSQDSQHNVQASFQIEVFPFTWWLWFGGSVLLFGTMIALWPIRTNN